MFTPTKKKSLMIFLSFLLFVHQNRSKDLPLSLIQKILLLVLKIEVLHWVQIVVVKRILHPLQFFHRTRSVVQLMRTSFDRINIWNFTNHVDSLSWWRVNSILFQMFLFLNWLPFSLYENLHGQEIDRRFLKNKTNPKLQVVVTSTEGPTLI